MWAAKPSAADWRARSSTSWMLTGRGRGRAQVAELLDLLEERHDAARLLHDEVGELQVVAL
jgi:hypothetical protein